MPVEVSVDAARAAARLSKRLETALAAQDLSLPQYRLLSFLSRQPVAASVLAETLLVSPPTVTTLVDGLVARDLVERSTDAADRRRVRHELTPGGRRTLAAADSALAERIGQLVSHLTPAQARRAVEGLELWHAALDAELDEMAAAHPETHAARR